MHQLKVSFQKQFWCYQIVFFHYCSPEYYCSLYFVRVKLLLFLSLKGGSKIECKHIAIASKNKRATYCYAFFTLAHCFFSILLSLQLSLSQLLRYNCCCSFWLLKAIAKSKEKLLTIAIAGRAIPLEKINKRSKKVESINFARSNREKSNIAITIK